MAGLIVVGAGAGIGASVAARFAKEGFSVGLVARSQETLDSVQGRLSGFGGTVVAEPADASDGPALRTALDRVVGELGPPEVVVYNAAVIRADGIGDLSIAEHQAAWAVNVAGAITTAARVIPAMQDGGGGTFIITGGMPEVDHRYVSLSLGKAGVRALVEVIDQENRDQGIHAATVTVAGAVAPGTAFDPDDIAEHYWRLHAQPRDEWSTEIVHSG